MIRTPEQYVESLNDGRVLYLDGERIPDITKEPKMRGAINAVATNYYLANDPEWRDLLTVEEDGDTVLTHCNAGSLATVDYGTALGVIRAAIEEGKAIEVISCETRPRQQGAKLTCYELMRDNIPVTLISDTMVGYVMSQGLVDKVVVGADRIVRDAVLNKIGTYNVAVLASEHGIPFYVAAPMSTMDQSSSSEDAVIEERSPTELTFVGSERIAPEGIKVMNPAFDITPLEYVDAVITEKGIFRPEMGLKQKRNE